MNKAFSNLLKYIDKLPHTKKYINGLNAMLNLHFQLVVVYINEMRETRFKEGFVCPHCSSEHIVRS